MPRGGIDADDHPKYGANGEYHVIHSEFSAIVLLVILYEQYNALDPLVVPMAGSLVGPKQGVAISHNNGMSTLFKHSLAQ